MLGFVPAMVCRSGDVLAGDVGRVFPLKTGVIERTGDVIRALFATSTHKHTQEKR